MNKVFHGKMEELILKLDDESVDIILTDPPYLYLKNQKIEREFDEDLFFSECKRVLKPTGFIAFFGRGVSFYRWNNILNELGFQFKEEIVWDKLRITSPVLPLGRRHELINIYSKSKGKIKSVKVDFFEKYKHEPEKITRTVERLATTFGNRHTFELLKKYYESGYKEYYKSADSKFNVTRSKNSNLNMNRTVVFAVGLEEGIKEQSIIKECSDHYKTVHPTQKPVKLLERILALISEPGGVVLDPFAGSCSTGIAAINMNLNFIGFEIDKEYFQKGNDRFRKHLETKKNEAVQTTINYNL